VEKGKKGRGNRLNNSSRTREEEGGECAQDLKMAKKGGKMPQGRKKSQFESGEMSKAEFLRATKREGRGGGEDG